MDKEDFVSLEVAKLLKEKVFDEDCMVFYTKDGLFECNSYINTNVLKHPTPTLYEAQKWLRKQKSIYVWVEPVIGSRWKISFCDFNVCVEESDWIEREFNKQGGYPVYETYEEALNAGILEALKLIE